VWTAAGGGPYGAKPRPVVIVQDDRFDATDSITVCPLTTAPERLLLFRVPVEPAQSTGLRERSFAMADKVATIPKARLGARVGLLAAAEMAALNRAIALFLGLADGGRR
jgi:mRNA interferase MazF